MKKKSNLSYLMLIVFALGLLSACNSGNNGKTPSPTEQAYPTAEPYELMEGSASEFSVSKVFSKDMILQRDAEIAVYGMAPESENGQYIEVEFKGIKGSSQIENGSWKAVFQGKFEASADLGHSLKVSGKEGTEVYFTDVLVGDIWYIGGQSNADMRFTTETRILYKESLDKFTKETPIRLFNQLNYDLMSNIEATESPQDNPLKRYRWTSASKAYIYDFSMLGIFFGARMLELNPDVPIGLVNVSCGGATLSILAPEEVLQTFPAQMIGKELPINNIIIRDKGIYNAFIHPFVGFGIKGMLFFQGESDTIYSDVYPQALKTYVEDLRDRFACNFEFLNVQLSSYGYVAGEHQLTGIWDLVNDMRNAQAKIRIENIISKYEVISSYDVGWQEGDADGAHPLYKKPLGDRLANIAGAKIYGIGDMESVACPIPKKVDFLKDKTVISFDFAGAKLVTGDSGKVNGFEVRYSGGWLRVEARIEGNKIVIDEGNVDGVRYGYALRNKDGSGGNVFSETGNPLVCFEYYKDKK